MADPCTCGDGVCGTGGWAGPLPGDPDNNSILTATAAYGGIDVSWSLPTLNAHAVIHTHIWRGINATFEQAILRTTEGGNFFFDRIPKEEIREYFYWIQIVSVNGTVGDPIGPASTVPMNSIEQTIEDLTGLIDAGTLAESLRTEIERVEIINQRIYQEIADRQTQNNILTTALAEVQADGDALTALVQEEVNLRISNNDTLAAAINTTQTELDGNIASVQTTMQASINTLDNKVGALYTAKVDVNGLVGGFGIYNDGTEVEAGFDVDRFWIGRTSEDKRKPFIVSDGVVYIDEGAINKLTFNKLRDESGTVVVENGKIKAAYLDADNLHVKGQISVGAFDGYAWPAAGQGGAYLGDSGFLIGNANGGGNYFQIVSGYGTGGNAAIYTNIPAYLEDLQVSTLKIANNSVTTTVSGTRASGSTAGLYTGNVTVPTGVTAKIVLSGEAYHITQDRDGPVALYRNETLIYYLPSVNWTYTWQEGEYSYSDPQSGARGAFFFVDNVGAGTYYYSLRGVSTPDGPANFRGTLVALTTFR